MKLTKAFAIYTGIAIIIFVGLMFFSPAYAMWGEALLAIAGFVGVIGLADKYIFTEVDIIESLKNGNMAVAIAFGSLLISFAILCFAVVGKG